MKLCVLGNSHAGMLVQAARATPPADLELTFFARAGRGPEGARLRGTELRAIKRDFRRSLARMGMPEAVNLAEQDCFALVGMTATVFSLLPALSTHQVFGWSPQQPDSDRALVSQAALEADLCAAIAANMAMDLVAKIRRVSAAPIFLVPQPFPSVEVLGGKSRHVGLRRIHQRREAGRVVACLARAHQRAFAGQAGVTLLDQPTETVAEHFLTAETYMRGASRLNPDGRQPEEDILHANAAYGAMVLDQLASAARKIRP